MKKTILTLGILSAMAFAANAQDAAAPSSSELKAGKITIELNATSPFAGTGSPFSLSDNNTGALNDGIQGALLGLRGRYFLNETTAIRLGLSINRSGFNNTYGTTETVTTAAGTGTDEQNKLNVKSSSFTFSIMPGIEKHILVSERLSAYYGGYFELTASSQKSKATVSSGSVTPAGGSSTPNFDGSFTEEWKGASISASDVSTALTSGVPTSSAPGSPSVLTSGASINPGFFRFGLVGVLGADYYFTKGLYLGVELGWGLTSTSYKKVEHTITNSAVAHGDPGATTTDKTTDLDKNKSGLQLAPYANANFRFGFRF